MDLKLKRIGSLLMAIALTFTLLETPVLAAVQGIGLSVSTSGSMAQEPIVPDEAALEESRKANKEMLDAFEKTFTLSDYLSAEVQNLTGKTALPSKAGRSAATKKTVENISVFVNFADFPTYATAQAREAANKTFNKSGLNSLGGFISKMSYGTTDVNTSFYPANGEVVLPNAFGYYCKKTDSNQIGYSTKDERVKRESEMVTFIANAISEEVKASGKKFDGSSISFIFPTNTKMTGVEYGELLWPHKTDFNTAGGTITKPTIAGTAVGKYNVLARGSESVGLMGTAEETRTAAIVVHEFMHTLGMPDLYRYRDLNTTAVGIWDIMEGDFFPSPLNALYQREYLNFANPLQTETETGKKQITLQLPQYADQSEKNAIKVSAFGSDKEYFVIEARKQSIGKQAGAEKTGLLVYRINTNVNASAGNTGAKDYMYVLRPGETAFGAGNGDINGALVEAGESFGMPTSYTGTGYGQTLYYENGTNSGIVISNVSVAGDAITFDLEIPSKTEENAPPEQTPEQPKDETTPEQPTETPNETGTEASPYVITKAADLALLQQHPKAYFTLANDIDLTADTFTTITTPFEGVLDGKGHTIRNSASAGATGGLFQTIGAVQGTPSVPSATIKDLTLENFNITATGDADRLAVSVKGALINNVNINGFDISTVHSQITVDDKGVFAEVSKVEGLKAEYSSSDESVLSVKANGEYTANKAGEATVSALIIIGTATYTLSQKVEVTAKANVDTPSAAGWVTKNEGKYYTLADGSFAKGIVKIGDYTYGFNEAGVLHTAPFVHEEKNYVPEMAKGDGYALRQNEVFTFNDGQSIADENCVQVANNFAVVNGKTYYQDGNFHLVTGKQTINEKLYLFNNDCTLRKGEAFVDDYYINEDGTLAVGIVEIDGKLYGFGTDGVIFKTLFTLNEKRYIPDTENGFALHKNKVFMYEDGLTAVDEFGVQVNYGWVKIEGKTYYQSITYHVLTGEQKIEGTAWHFDDKGVLQTEQGLFTKGNGTYYKHTDGHLAANEIVEVDGKLYGFDENNLMHKKRFSLNGKYYVPNAQNGFALHQDEIIDYAGAKSAIDKNAVQALGIVEVQGKKYYQTEMSEYKLVKGKQTIGDKIYVFDNFGVMREKPGFVGVPEGAYYVKADGSLATGVFDISTYKYGFDEEGLLYKEVFTIDGNRYVPNPIKGYSLRQSEAFNWDNGITVVDENCVQAVGKIVKTADNKKYYQTVESGYKVVKGKQTIDNKMYVFDNFGVMREKAGFVGVPEGAYYVKADGSLATGVFDISTYKYGFDEEGLLYKNPFTIGGNRYIPNPIKGYSLRQSELFTFDGGKSVADENSVQAVNKIVTTADGKKYYQTVESGYKVLTGKQIIDGVMYIFDTDGAMKDTKGFVTTPEGTYYINDDGSLATGIVDIGANKYGFDANGLLYQDVFTFNNNRYVPNPTKGYALRKSELFAFDGGKSVVDENGIQTVNKMITVDGKKYYQTVESGYKVLTGKQTIDGVMYIFDTNGAMRESKGFVNTPEGAYYIQEDGTLAKGIITLGEYKYGFDANGLLYKDAFVFENNRYMPNPIKGYSLRKNEVFNVVGGKSFADENSVQVIDKFTKIGDKTYYQTAASGYKALTGKQTINGKMYIFDKDGALNETEGFVDTPDGTYYVKADGSLAKGFEKLGAKGSEALYAFDDNNLLYKKAFALNGKNYLPNPKNGYALFQDGVFMVDDAKKDYSVFDKDGVRTDSGFTEVNGSTYYQTAATNYLVIKGHQRLNEVNYYFDPETGKQQNGWVLINGKYTYFNPSTEPAGAEAIVPVMQVANSYDAATKTFVITINAVFGNMGPDEKAFSFDGGKTWQASNTKSYDGKTALTIAAGQLMIRPKFPKDTTAQQQAEYIVKNTSAINLTPPAIQGNRGIDVSKYQGSINWQSVASSGISFALIKAVGCNENGTYYIDPFFEQNVRNAKAAGIKVGAYIFSYANSIERVKREVDFFVNSPELQRILASGIKFDLPVYIDYEDDYQLEGTDYALRTAIVRTGMILLEKAGFYPGFYTYQSYMNYFNAAGLVSEGYTFWYARYPAVPVPENRPSDVGTRVDIWQYCSDGNFNPAMKPYVNGITSAKIDLNIMYEDLVSKVYKFYSDIGQGGGGGTTPPPMEPTLMVYDEKTTQIVSGPVKTILAQIVQAEVGPFGNAELYKAQAVAAHSWIQYQNSKGNSAPRVALAPPSTAVINAVNEVAAEMVMYGNSVANTMYGSANNTKTTSAQQMWGGGDAPYLRAGIDSPHDINATVSLSDKRPWYNKTNNISTERAKSNIEKMLGVGATDGRDPSTWLGAIATDASGYVTSIEVCGRQVAGGKFFDNFYGLYSPSFTYQYNGNGTWTFTTRGNGHCVGMSQWGAYGFTALNGWNYKQVLAHYYPDTTVKVN